MRHGQASFGADDYDVLSDVGHEQAATLGRAWSTSSRPGLVLSGALRRQRDTVGGVLRAAGWDTAAEVDDRWDEFDHVGVTQAHGDADMRTMDRRTFQTAFEAATARWSVGEPPAGGIGVETWSAFADRVRGALASSVAAAGPGTTVLVVSSGGPIALAAALLLGADDRALPAVWSRLNTVIVNSAVTTVVVGSTGSRLLTFNAHDHLTGDLLTYR